jgi:hypothetical protein
LGVGFGYGFDLAGGLGGGFGCFALGLEAAEFVEAAVQVALGGIDAALDAGEGSDVVGEDFAVGHIVVRDLLHAFALAFPGFGFDFAEAALEPGVMDDGVDEVGLGWVGRLVFGVESGGESFERCGVLASDDLGFGIDAGLQVIETGDGLALWGAGGRWISETCDGLLRFVSRWP